MVSHLAAKALWMPLGAEGGHKPFHDCPLTALTPRGKLLIVALRTVRLAVLLMETLGPKVLATQSAKEVLRMPSLAQSSHAALEEERKEEEEKEEEIKG